MLNNKKGTRAALHALLGSLTLISSFNVAQAAEMKVLIAVGENVTDLSVDNTVIAALNNTLSATPGLQLLSFQLASPIVIPSLCSADTDGDLNDELSCAEADLAFVRDSLKADLVMLIVDQHGELPPLGDDCGSANRDWTSISVSNDDEAFSVVDYNCLSDNLAVAAHEIGHNLGLEHEIGGSIDIFPTLPVTFNHGYETPVGEAKTVMYSSSSSVTDMIFSNTSSDIGPNNETAGNLSDAFSASVVEFFSWLPVSWYRENQSPPPNLYVMACFCQNKDGRQELSWTSSDWTPLGQTFQVEKQSGGGSWSQIFDGDPECLILNATFAGILHRVRILVDGMIPSEWSYILLQCDCLNQGGGGGPL